MITKFEENSNIAVKKPDFPKLSIKKPILSIKKFKDYYIKNFGMKHSFLDAYISFKSKILKENPLPSNTIFGKNDFTFLGNSYSNVVSESFGMSIFTNNELIKIKENIANNKKWLKEQNIKLYIAIAPNKHNVYSENFPLKINYTEQRKTQVIKYIKDKIQFDIIDLGISFKTEKTKIRLYRKSDSHWNDIGAFYAYKTLINEIGKDYTFEKLSFSNFQIDSIKTDGGISNIKNVIKKEKLIVLKPLFKTNSVEIKEAKYYSKSLVSESRYKNTAKKYKALIFRDSFSNALIPFLNETFGECKYVWSHKFDRELILKEKPDIVIMQYVDRFIERLKE